MKITTKTRGGAFISTALCSFATIASFGFYMSGNLTNTAELKSKDAALKLVVAEYVAGNCWVQKSDFPFKIYDRIELGGTRYGKSPTSCIENNIQFAKIAELEGQFVVTNVFSRKQVIGQIKGK